MTRFLAMLFLVVAVSASSGCCCHRSRDLPVGLDHLMCRLQCLPGGFLTPPFSCQTCPYYDYRCRRWRTFCTSCNCAPTAFTSDDVEHDPEYPDYVEE